jgi:hypothetical protein
MASIISAGTTSGTALNMAGDTSGVLELATNGSTTALTIDTSQNATFAGKVTSAGALTLASNGTTTALTIDTSQNVGIGTTAPTTKLTVNSNTVLPSAGAITGTTFWNVGADSTLVNILMDSFSAGSSIIGRRAQGTAAAPSAVDASNNLMRVLGYGYGTSAYSSAARVAMDFQPDQTWTDAAQGTKILFITTTNGTTTTAERMRIDSSGSLILAGSTAQKASGTTWSNPSDQRLKDNIRDYTKGTTELMQVRVREWEYNGKGGTTEGLKGLGVVADEVMTVLPNTVETYDAKLNAEDEETTEIKKFDATEITWLLVKTVQEQQTIINDLKARITALEGAA